MLLKNVLVEDFVNYKKPCMFLATCYCDWKCCIDDESCQCQNSDLTLMDNIEVDDDELIDRYLGNKITESIVIAGLEPMIQIDEVIAFIKKFREKSEDDVVVYTGYYEDEIKEELEALKRFSNIVVKFGRYKSGQNSHRDEVLGVDLANKEQYAKKIS